MLHRQRARYALPIWLGNFIKWLSLFMNDVQNYKLAAFYKIALLISFVWNESIKRCKLITKKRLNDALPVLSNIQVIMM